MKVKKYIATTMAEALTQIKEELGSDAVILNSKKVKVGGMFGLFKQTKLEVIAALDEHPIPPRKESKVEIRKQTPAVERAASNSQREVLQEIKELRQLVTTQSRYVQSNFKPPFDDVLSYLIEEEVHPTVAEEIVSTIETQAEQLHVSEKDMSSHIFDTIQKEVEPQIKASTSFDKQVIQFVGPTGVGKTTTIAKVAAKTMLEHHKKVAFITTDTYRIAAIEQLKTYAKILDIPIEVAYTNDDYEYALGKFAKYDHIFVDTAGRNYRETSYLKDINNMITFQSSLHETYLVLSLTAKSKDNMDIYRIFSEEGIEQIIFTKSDETSTYGTIMNMCFKEGATLACISNGQNVPDDIIYPDAEYVTKLLMRRYFYE